MEFRGTDEVVGALERDDDNYSAALDFLTAAGETQQVLRLAAALAEFWFRADCWAELRVHLLGAVRADTRPSEARARALLSACDVAALGGDHAQALRVAEEALAYYGERGDRRGVADALIRIAGEVEDMDDLPRARPLLEEACALYHEVDDQDALLQARRMLAWNLERSGERNAANALYRENLERSRVIGNPLVLAASLGWLATVAAEEGRFDEAFAQVREHLPIACALDNYETAIALMRVARVLWPAGHALEAVRLLGAAEAMFEEMGITDNWGLAELRKLEAVARNALDQTEFENCWKDGRARAPDDAVALALD